MADDTVEVVRILIYRGDRTWIEKTMAMSINSTKYIGNGRTITARTLEDFPRILDEMRKEANEAPLKQEA